MLIEKKAVVNPQLAKAFPHSMELKASSAFEQDPVVCLYPKSSILPFYLLEIGFYVNNNYPN
jgi:hypothetical protein